MAALAVIHCQFKDVLAAATAAAVHLSRQTTASLLVSEACRWRCAMCAAVQTVLSIRAAVQPRLSLTSKHWICYAGLLHPCLLKVLKARLASKKSRPLRLQLHLASNTRSKEKTPSQLDADQASTVQDLCLLQALLDFGKWRMATLCMIESVQGFPHHITWRTVLETPRESQTGCVGREPPHCSARDPGNQGHEAL